MKIIITGGLGFIGSNAVRHFYNKGHDVVVIDNLSRGGAKKNLKWLESIVDFTFIKEDVRNVESLRRIFTQHKDVDVLIHLAAQVAVTTSVLNPMEDFEINALGTINLLETVRTLKLDPVIIYASTNKVYGKLENVEVVENETSYEFANIPLGVTEEHPLNFHSPYGCSKGVADQYIRDYARIYGMKTVVLRQSCIYGERQFGIEDQGWVAWFIIAATTGKPVKIFGNGKQVRDILNVGDLISCYELCIEKIDLVAGEIFNVGGGAANSISIMDFIALIEKHMGKNIQALSSEIRHGDQPIFISNNKKAKNLLSWAPSTAYEDGIKKMFEWVVCQNEAVREAGYGAS